MCGKNFQTESGLKQHIRRRYCRGPNPDTENRCSYCPLEDAKCFSSYAGLRQHIRLSHAVDYNRELEDQIENPIRAESAWTDIELTAMAKAEIEYKGRFINKFLTTVMQGRTAEAIKSRRRCADYITLRDGLRCASPPATDTGNDVSEKTKRESQDLDVFVADGDIVVDIYRSAATSSRLEGAVMCTPDSIVEEELVRVEPDSPSTSKTLHSDVVKDPTENNIPSIHTNQDEAVPQVPNNINLNPEASCFIPTRDVNNMILNSKASCFLPTRDANSDPVYEFLMDLIQHSNSKWDEVDQSLINLVNSRDEITKKRQLEYWLNNLIKKVVRSRTQEHKKCEKYNPTNIDKYSTKQKRALIYKKTQELFRRNRSELAECILDDKPPLSSITSPPFDELTTKFTNIFSSDSPLDNEPFDRLQSSTDLYTPINSNDLDWALKTTKSNSAGPDGLRIRHLRTIERSKLLLLFNIILYWGYIPTSLKSSRTILIPKTSSPSNADDWRPITISSILLRIINKIIGKRLSRIPLHHLQRGFRGIDGVLLNNLTLDYIIKDKRRTRKPYNVVSIDLQKAFDTISHSSIERALNRFSVDERLQKVILDGYSNTNTYIQLGSLKSDSIQVRRGVKQGDPLSPYLFNMIMDELFYHLENSNYGIPTLETRLSCVGYADDLVLFASSISDMQKLLKIAVTFFDKRGLVINNKKCMATSVGIVPGKKILYTITKNIFHLKGALIPQHSVGEFWKYLGCKVSALGIAKPNIPTIKTQLLRIEKAPLKPAQKLTIIKTYLIPRLIHLLQNPRLTLKMLKTVDIYTRITTRRILHLNRTCADAYLHAPLRFGGLGILSMRTLIPTILHNRLLNLTNSYDDYARKLSSTDVYKSFSNKLFAWTMDIDGSAALKWGEKLEQSYSGNGIIQATNHFHSSSWIDAPPNFWSGGDYIKAIQLRGNLLPTQGIPSNPKEQRKCRGGCERVESLSHVLQKCPVTHWNRIRRHDRIVGLLERILARKGWKVEVEPRIRCASGLLKIPDLICIKNQTLVVCDIAISWEGPQTLDVTYNHKRATYNDKDTIAAIKTKYKIEDISVEALIIGARGIWCRLNTRTVSKFTLTKNNIHALITNTINGSIIIHRQFMKLTYK